MKHMSKLGLGLILLFGGSFCMAGTTLPVNSLPFDPGSEGGPTLVGGPHAFNVEPAISADGRYVLYGEESLTVDLILKDLQSSNLTRLITLEDKVIAGGGVYRGASFDMSADARYVVFSTISSLTSNDNNEVADIYLLNIVTSEIILISVGQQAAPANDWSFYPKISDNGRYVVFFSDATNLVNGDTNGVTDVFRYDLYEKKVQRISVSNGGEQANGSSPSDQCNWNCDLALSADGTQIVFSSLASNLVDNDTNDNLDVFWVNTNTSSVKRVSISDRGKQLLSGDSHSPAISAQGNIIAFISNADNVSSSLVHSGYDEKVYLYYTNTGKIESANPSLNDVVWVGNPSLSIDGRFLSYSSAYDIETSSTTFSSDYMYRRDNLNGNIERIDVRADGSPPESCNSFYCEISDFFAPSISADGRYIAFSSPLSLYPVGSDNDFYFSGTSIPVYTRDLVLSRRQKADISISPQVPAFASQSELMPVVLSVTNHSTEEVSNVSLTHVLSDVTTNIVSFELSDANSRCSVGVVTSCNLRSLQPGESKTLELLIEATTSGTLNHRSSVVFNGRDFFKSNNFVQRKTDVQ